MSQGGFEAQLAERKRVSAESARYEALLARDPAAYRRLVKRWIALGVVYFLFLVALAFAIAAAVVALWLYGRHGNVQVTIFAALFLWAIGSAIFLRLPKPRGQEVARSEFPALWSAVEEIARRLGAPPVDRIFLDLENNASAAQLTRFLFLPGRVSNVLTLGLPYLLATGPDETRATIAHELGHFAGSHSRFSIKAYRFASAIATVAARQRNGIGALLTVPFLNFYSPRIEALLGPLRRRHEFEADDAATRLDLGGANRGDLLRMAVVSPWYYRRFAKRWLPEARRAGGATLYLSRMKEALAAPLDPDDGALALQRALDSRTGPGDSHPALTERLAAFAAPPSMDDLAAALAPRIPSAADAFLGEGAVERIADRFATVFASADAKGAPPVAVAPPTPLELAEARLAEGGIGQGGPALLAIARDGGSESVDRLRAVSLLVRERLPETEEAALALVDDRFVGIDALALLVALARQQKDEAAERTWHDRLEARRKEIKSLRDAVQSGRDPGLFLRPPTAPGSVLDVFMARLTKTPRIARVVAFDAALPGGPPRLVLLADATAGVAFFRMTRDDPKQTALAIENALRGPGEVIRIVTTDRKLLDRLSSHPAAHALLLTPSK